MVGSHSGCCWKVGKLSSQLAAIWLPPCKSPPPCHKISHSPCYYSQEPLDWKPQVFFMDIWFQQVFKTGESDVNSYFLHAYRIAFCNILHFRIAFSKILHFYIFASAGGQGEEWYREDRGSLGGKMLDSPAYELGWHAVGASGTKRIQRSGEWLLRKNGC